MIAVKQRHFLSIKIVKDKKGIINYECFKLI